MLYVEKGSVVHKNLMLLHAVLWPEDCLADLDPKFRDPEIYLYHRWGKKKEECWVRFVHGDEFRSYWLNSHWTETLTGKSVMPARSVPESILNDLLRPNYEFPMEMLKPSETHEWDEVTQDDFRNIEGLSKKLHDKMAKNLDEITRKANRFVEAARHRDHELYMSFNLRGEEKNTFALRFDKVYPKLPTEGFQLGEGDTLTMDIAEGDTLTATVFNRLKILERTINRDIVSYRTIGNFGPAATKLFNKEVTTLLYAATHFSKRIYPLDGEACKPLMEELANDILAKLRKVKNEGLNIGLDVSSWIVWEYHADGSEPTRLEDPELNFRDQIVEGYLDGFTTSFMGYLMDLQVNDLIRPYSHVVKADASDGIEVGSIRVVK